MVGVDQEKRGRLLPGRATLCRAQGKEEGGEGLGGPHRLSPAIT